MSAVRRSTRLSISKAAVSAASAGVTRRTEIWRRRQTKPPAAVDSDDESFEGHKLSESEDDNNENLDVMNKLSKGTPMKATKSASMPSNSSRAKVEPSTPRSKKRDLHPGGRPKEKPHKDTSTQRLSDTDESDEDVQQVSPPKQMRQEGIVSVSQHLISPTRLLDRLSIDERQEYSTECESDDDEPHAGLNQNSKLDEKKRNKYQNARRVLNSAETLQLPGREKQLEDLRNFFREHLNEKRSGSLYVSGQPGTGKTACLSLLLRSSEFQHRLQRVYVNCTSIASVGGIYKKLCAELKLRLTGRTEKDCLAAIQKYLQTATRMVLIVLDEIDQLCSSRQSILYTIFEWPSLPRAQLLLVGIANSLDLTDRALMRLNARCELKPILMHFPPYSKQEIIDIFKGRLEQAGVLDVFPPVSLQLLAAKVSAVSGDVRRALDIGRRVIEIAEQQKKSGQREIDLKQLDNESGKDGPEKVVAEPELKPVQVTQVAAVLNKVYGASQNLQEDIEDSFPLQQKIMLCSLMLILRNEKHKDISLGRLHEVYRRICSKRNIHDLDQAEFVNLVDLVETRGILRIIRKKEPRLSKVQLQWDEDEVNSALRDKQLIASILDDIGCLRK